MFIYYYSPIQNKKELLKSSPKKRLIKNNHLYLVKQPQYVCKEVVSFKLLFYEKDARAKVIEREF